MRKEIMRRAPESRVHWEQLEEWVRGQVQGLIQELLEQEKRELVGPAPRPDSQGDELACLVVGDGHLQGAPPITHYAGAPQ